MSRKTLFLLISTAVFFVLLYRQEPGLNFLLYGFYMITSSFIFSPKVTQERITVAICLIISTLSVALYGETFYIPYSVLLFLLLGYFLYDPKGKLLLSPFYLGANYLLEITQIPKLFESDTTQKIANQPLRIMSLFILPITIVFIFVLIYKEVNLQFADMINSLQFPEVKPELFLILFMAFFFNLGFWFFTSWFKAPEMPNEIQNYSEEQLADEKNSIWLQSGMVVFGLLNLLLIVVLVMDFKETARQIHGMSERILTDSLHLSVGAVIGSIVVGVSLVFLYLKGELNFISLSSRLKNLIYIWVGLNMLLLINTGIKNHIYIEVSGLTEKRLGVISFLIVTAIGLYFTYRKIKYDKSYWYIINPMLWTFLIYLSLIGPINWSKIITHYNLKDKGRISMKYLNTLNFNTIELYEYALKKGNISESQRLKSELIRQAKEYRERSFLSQTLYDSKVEHYVAQKFPEQK